MTIFIIYLKTIIFRFSLSAILLQRLLVYFFKRINWYIIDSIYNEFFGASVDDIFGFRFFDQRVKEEVLYEEGVELHSHTEIMQQVVSRLGIRSRLKLFCHWIQYFVLFYLFLLYTSFLCFHDHRVCSSILSFQSIFHFIQH